MNRLFLWILFFRLFLFYLYAEGIECSNLNYYIKTTKNKYGNKIKSAISAIDEITYTNLYIRELNNYIINCYKKTNNDNLKEALKNAYKHYKKVYSLGKKGLLLRGSAVTSFANDMKDENILSGLFSAALNADEIERLNKKYIQNFLEGNKYLNKALDVISNTK